MPTLTLPSWLPRLDLADLVTSDLALRRLQTAYRERADPARPLPAFGLTLVDGKRWAFGAGAPAFEIVVRDARGQAAIASLDEMRCCEAYMAGSIDIDGDLLALTGLRAILGDARPLQLLWARHLRARILGQVRSDVQGIADHYDEDPDFYLLFLDPTRCYSHALFSRDDEPLEQAMRRKLDFALDAVDARPGMRLLDIGAGWGAMTETAGKRGIDTTSLTISRRSEAYVRDLITAQGLPARVIREHLLEYRPDRPYDAIVNLGVSEHLPDYAATLACYERLLVPGGKIYLDACSSRVKHPFRSFMYRYIFPGNGTPVCVHEYLAEVARTRFEVEALHNDRHNYALTARRWAENLDRHADEITRRWGLAWYRRFRLWLWGCVDVFSRDHYGAYRLVLRRK
ncbi:MAG: class I SAM-dependent methyltransferase [Myxococcales bacterium]|nr:class I SAM-dependent methyltransferase [Myxococcales bacterium]